MARWVKNISSSTQLTEWEKTYGFVCDMEVWWDTPRMEQQVVRDVRTESHKEIENMSKNEFVPLEIQEKMKKNEKEERMRKESRKRAGR
uniref:Uncharacterized protein n=1 Tax=Marseillevirus sp. TaxID=2809551 RepID=A0AA96ELZ1_9VIRU|nr:hypothetical protein MarDSR_020 [Marseillevirus sp.]